MTINMPSHIQRIVEANLAAVIILRINALYMWWHINLSKPETWGFQQAIADFWVSLWRDDAICQSCNVDEYTWNPAQINQSPSMHGEEIKEIANELPLLIFYKVLTTWPDYIVE